MTARVFVTGAAGFIGGRTVRSLRERGEQVVAIVRDPTGATALRDLGVRLIAGNLASQDEIQEAMSGSDSVIHLAGSYRVGDPAVRAAGDVRGERDRHGTGPGRGHRGRDPQDRAGFDDQRLREYARASRR